MNLALAPDKNEVASRTCFRFPPSAGFSLDSVVMSTRAGKLADRLLNMVCTRAQTKFL